MTRRRIFEILFSLYVFSMFAFTPLAAILHIIFLIYLSVKKEWQLVLIAVMIFILGCIIGVIVGYNHMDTNSWLFLLIRLFFLGLNITWVIYALKKIKYNKS